jgi:hypothetical protein
MMVSISPVPRRIYTGSRRDAATASGAPTMRG